MMKPAQTSTFDAVIVGAGTLAIRVRNLCFERGLATRAVREGLVFSPPLVISEAEIGELVSILSSCLDDAWTTL